MRRPPAHRFRALWQTATLAVLSMASRRRIIGRPTAPVVTLTTFGRRLTTVHITIEAIARGTVLPSRLILYVDETDINRLPKPIHRQQKRGLDVRAAPPAWGPHKKYFPFCLADRGDDDEVLVTADDDILYPARWLEQLQRAHEGDPGTIWAHKTRGASVDVTGDLRPYQTWQESPNIAASSFQRVPIGMGGVAYPGQFTRILASAGDDFMTVAPRADDLWLHAQAVRHGFRVGQVNQTSMYMPLQIRSQGSALAQENQNGGGNDRVIGELYTSADRSRIMNDS